MALSLVAVGAQVKAAIANAIIGQVNAQGLTGVVPTSVAGTGVVVGTAGKVTFTAATAVSLNGCFTTAYDTYEIVITVTSIASGTPGTNLRLRTAGTDLSSSVYTFQGTAAISSAVSTSTTAPTTQYLLGFNGVGTYGIHKITINGPALGANKGIQAHTHFTNTGTGVSRTDINDGMILSASAADGFTILLGSSTMTGTIRVYGYNNN